MCQMPARLLALAMARPILHNQAEGTRAGVLVLLKERVDMYLTPSPVVPRETVPYLLHIESYGDVFWLPPLESSKS